MQIFVLFYNFITIQLKICIKFTSSYRIIENSIKYRKTKFFHFTSSVSMKLRSGTTLKMHNLTKKHREITIFLEIATWRFNGIRSAFRGGSSVFQRYQQTLTNLSHQEGVL